MAFQNSAVQIFDELYKLIKSLKQLVRLNLLDLLSNIEFFPVFHGSHTNQFVKNFPE